METESFHGIIVLLVRVYVELVWFMGFWRGVRKAASLSLSLLIDWEWGMS